MFRSHIQIVMTKVITPSKKGRFRAVEVRQLTALPKRKSVGLKPRAAGREKELPIWMHRSWEARSSLLTSRSHNPQCVWSTLIAKAQEGMNGPNAVTVPIRATDACVSAKKQEELKTVLGCMSASRIRRLLRAFQKLREWIESQFQDITAGMLDTVEDILKSALPKVPVAAGA